MSSYDMPGDDIVNLLSADVHNAGPVDADEEGERIRVNVGPISRRSPRTFVFDRFAARPASFS